MCWDFLAPPTHWQQLLLEQCNGKTQRFCHGMQLKGAADINLPVIDDSHEGMTQRHAVMLYVKACNSLYKVSLASPSM